MEDDFISANNTDDIGPNDRKRITPPGCDCPRLKIELATAGRMRLSEQIRSRMESLGYQAYDYDKLKLGFELPITWPADKDSEITLVQLTVLAEKLDMRIFISDSGIDLTPMPNQKR